MRIAVVGAGGLGGYFGACLAQSGQDVTFIARGENLRALRARGLEIQSPRGDFVVSPVRATDKPDRVGIADLVLFGVKAYDVDSVLEYMRPLVGTGTAILPMQNGIEHVAKLQHAFGADHVLGGLVMINAHKGAPGVVHHVADSGQHQLEFGEWTGELSDRCTAFQAIFGAAGLDTALVANIVERMWWKLAVFSGAIVLAVARGPKATVWIDEVKALTHQAVAETVAVAAAHGVILSSALPDDVVALEDRLPAAYKPSLLVDLERGRPLELEAIAGFVTRLGRQLAVPTSVNDFVYACLKPHANGAT